MKHRHVLSVRPGAAMRGLVNLFLFDFATDTWLSVVAGFGMVGLLYALIWSL